MSLFTQARDIAEQSAASYYGVNLPAKQPKVITATTSSARAQDFIQKYKVALLLAAGLGVLVLIKMRR